MGLTTNQYLRACAEVRTPVALGAGIAIGPRHLLTAAHVIIEYVDRPEAIEVTFPFTEPDTRLRGIRCTVKAGQDIALIELLGEPPGWLPPAPKPFTEYSGMVYVWGATATRPEVRPWAVMAGEIIGDGKVNVPVVKGCSGSGVAHVETGVILGVVTGYLPQEPFPDRFITYVQPAYPFLAELGWFESTTPKPPPKPGIWEKLPPWAKDIARGVLIGVGTTMILSFCFESTQIRSK